MNKDAKHLNLRTLFHCLGAGITALFSSFLPHLKSRIKDASPARRVMRRLMSISLLTLKPGGRRATIPGNAGWKATAWLQAPSSIIAGRMPAS